MREEDYFEQFVGDDPAEYGTITRRLVYAPTGQSIEWSGTESHAALHELWVAIGSPSMALSDLTVSIIDQTFANGKLIKEVHGW